MEVNREFSKDENQRLRKILFLMFNMPIHKKLQITTTLRFNLTPAGMVKIRKKIKQRKKNKITTAEKNDHKC